IRSCGYLVRLAGQEAFGVVHGRPEYCRQVARRVNAVRWTIRKLRRSDQSRLSSQIVGAEKRDSAAVCNRSVLPSRGERERLRHVMSSDIHSWNWPGAPLVINEHAHVS